MRALAVGSLIGVVLAATNVYMGLKTGWWDGGAITASILGAVMLGAIPRFGRGAAPAGPLENNIAQTTATSVGAMPAVAGLIAALPALQMLGIHVSGFGIAAWALGLGVLGVLVALLLRKRLLVDENLPFPSGIATAELISALHAEGRAGSARAKALVGTGLAAMAFTWLRDGQRWIPGATYFPGMFRGVPAASLTLGMNWSALMLGAGVLVGLRMGASVLAGSVIAWMIAAPLLLSKGIVAEAEYGALTGWLAWPGVALMVGASAVTLVQQAGTLRATLRDMRSLHGGGEQANGRGSAAVPILPRRVVGALAVGSVGLIVLTGSVVFGLGPLACLLLVGVSVVLGLVCARAAGQTDFAPAGNMGQLTQAMYAAATTGSAAMNVAAGSVPSGSAVQTASSLWAFRAGERLGASPRNQAIATLLGVAVGAAVSVPVYLVLVSAYGLGSANLPAVSAVAWKNIAGVLAGNAGALPPWAAQASIAAFAVGVVLAGLESSRVAATRAGKWIPSPAALGVGFIMPFGLALAIFVGAVLVTIAEAVRPAKTQMLAPSVAAGAIAGESLMGAAVAILIVLGVVSAPA